MAEEETYTIAEVARFTGLHKNTIRRHIKAGELRAEVVQGKFGPEYRITKAALVESPPIREALRKVRGGEGFWEGVDTGMTPGSRALDSIYLSLFRDYQRALEELSEYRGRVLMLEAAEEEKERLSRRLEELERRLEETEERLRTAELELATVKGLSWFRFRRWRRQKEAAT